MAKEISDNIRQRKNKIDFLEIFNNFKSDDDYFTKVGKILGKGSFGEVREIVYKNKTMAGKIVMQENKEKSGENLAYDLRGRNIIKMNKIIWKEIDNQFYYLIIMEKALLRDLGKLTEFSHHHNLLKLIFIPFDEVTSDTLLRFYAIQIINALELLNRNNFVHFDLKPENLLITINLIVKLSDFSLLMKVNDTDKIKIPGGTNGYVSMEYYNKDEKISGKDARKQDFFSLGATLYYLKFGKQMIKIKNAENNAINMLNIGEKLEKEISVIKANKFSDQEFIDFLVSLIAYNPNGRPNFEQIYRNIWLNKNLLELHETFYKFEYDEEKLMLELQKQDFLVEVKKTISTKSNKFSFKKNRKRISK